MLKVLAPLFCCCFWVLGCTAEVISALVILPANDSYFISIQKTQAVFDLASSAAQSFLPSYEFKFDFRDDKCQPAVALRCAVSGIQCHSGKQNVNVIFGPTCEFSVANFWDEANSAEKIISASRLKELGKSDAAECLALTVLERMTKQQFSQIQSLESALLKDGVIVTKEMNDILRQIIETSGIEKEMKAVHPRPQEAVLLVIQQILRILNQSCSEIVQVETEDKRPMTVPKRMKRLMDQAKKLGIGDLNLPPIVYANERARLAMIERQIKGKMKLKNLHDKMDKNRAPSGLKTDKSLVKKHAEVKKRIRRVISIREKMKTELALENKDSVSPKSPSRSSQAPKEELPKSPTPTSSQKNTSPSKLSLVKNQSILIDGSKPSLRKSRSEDTADLEVIETALTRKMRKDELTFCPFTGKIKTDEFPFGMPPMHEIYSGNIVNVNIVQVENNIGDKIETNANDCLIAEEKQSEDQSSAVYPSDVDATQDNCECETNKEYFTIIKDDVPVSSQGSELFSKIHNLQYSCVEKKSFEKEINIKSPDMKVSSEPLLPSALLKSNSKSDLNFEFRIDPHAGLTDKRTTSCKKIVQTTETKEKEPDEVASDSARHIIHLLMNNVFAGRNETPNITLEETSRSEEDLLRGEESQQRCCESVRIRKSRWPFEIKYRSRGGPCSSSKGRLNEEDEQIEEFISASDVMKEEQISRLPTTGSTSLGSFAFEGLPGEEFDIGEIHQNPFILEGEGSSKWFRNSPCPSGDPLVVPSVPKKCRKHEAYAVFLLSAFLGVGAMGYFTSTGQHILSNLVMPASTVLETQVARIIKIWSIPMITTGGLTYDFSVPRTNMTSEFFLLVRLGMVDFKRMSLALSSIFERYGWRRMLLIYEKNGCLLLAGKLVCKLMMETLVEVLKLSEFVFHSIDLSRIPDVQLHEIIKRESPNYSSLDSEMEKEAERH